MRFIAGGFGSEGPYSQSRLAAARHSDGHQVARMAVEAIDRLIFQIVRSRV
jgi:hypothetical protein